MKNINRLLALSTLASFISGCASFGKGIAEAYFEKQETADTRVCEVFGRPFKGIMPYLENPQGKMKVLMVHGVGDHLPGYSTQFVEKLAKELQLNVRAKRAKNIALTDPLDTSKKLGNLRVQRLLNKARTKELLFYELTWSEITAKEKAVLAYDNSGEYSFRRAQVNDLLKKFSNDTGPDPIIYLGDSREDILIAFTQSFCWMINGKWQDLPDGVSQGCTFDNPQAVNNLHNDQYAFISHSLGSRITIDGMQRIAAFFGDSSFRPELKRPRELVQALREKEIPLYMMSNQLPMLQLGRKLPEVNGQKDAYCTPGGSHYNDRMVSKTSIIAFSDPNDLLSYAVPQGFVEKYLDSRLCIDATNININVATIFDAFGMGKMANPLDAHIGYDTDDRVVAMIAQGIGNGHTAKIVNEKCSWVETID
ncbi:MAG: hypothetical protein CVV13_12405 [Gammaproteobacteria bacterium HGW-Gammaproteobacteria-3]|nr:MAG: hypothetical protein CVV13_12405 [Gammaproteobacteria bacterium HGW-Gammaproteobacteria-3]